MFAFKKSRTLLAHTFSFLSRAPRRERLSSICGHKISMWSFCSGFASWLISPKPTLTDKSRVCVPVCVCLCVCGHATGVNPWQRADNSLSGHSGSVWTVNTLTLCLTHVHSQTRCTRLSFPPSVRRRTQVHASTGILYCVSVCASLCGCVDARESGGGTSPVLQRSAPTTARGGTSIYVFLPNLILNIYRAIHLG